MVTRRVLLDMEIPKADLQKIQMEIRNILNLGFQEPEKSIKIRRVFDKYRNENSENKTVMQRTKGPGQGEER